jgi:hypothetical protein
MLAAGMQKTKLFQAVVGFGLLMGACADAAVSAGDASSNADDAGTADAGATDATDAAPPQDAAQDAAKDAAKDAKLDGPHAMDAADGWHTTK